MSFGIRGRLFVLALISASCVVALAFVAWSALQEAKVFSPLYMSHVADMDFKADILPPPACAMEVYLATYQYRDSDPADRPKLKAKIEDLITAFEARWKIWVESETDASQRIKLEATRDLGREEIASIRTYVGQVDANAEEAARDATLAIVDKNYLKHLDAINEAVQFVDRRMEDRKSEMLAVSQMASNHLLFGSLAIVLVVMCGSWVIARSIIRPVSRVVSQLSDGADQVSSASNEVSAGAQRIAQGASQQAASLEETTASLEELSATCRQNANNARQANALASDEANASESGENTARRAATEVTTQLQELAKAIDAIRASTEKTTQVVESIDDIAIQINLLALNAAVEAARAGEAGLGFAVVADEVRNLAARSTEEAKNTSALIREARANTDRVHEVSCQVQEYLGRTLNQDVVGNFQKLVTMVRKVAQLSAEVAAASDEQSRGVGQINAAVAQMDKVTQENAASAEESAASSEEMQAQAVSLREGVSHLREVVGVTAEPVVAASGAVRTPVVHPTVAPVRSVAKSVSANGKGAHRPAATKSAAEIMPLTDDEAREHQGDFSRF